MAALLEGAIPLSQLLWQAETDGKDLSTPERRAGLEQRLKEIVEQITDRTVADYYRDGFRERVYDSFKRRPAAPEGRGQRGAFNSSGHSSGNSSGRPPGRLRGAFKPLPGTPDAVGASVQASALVRAGLAPVAAGPPI